MAATREAAPGAAYAHGKLSPGPGMSAEEVASHQCARIHQAMIEIVGERGYGAVTVRELINLAGVSTRAFYQRFQDKDECFLRTHELVVQRAAARIAAAQNGERDWLERMRLAFAAFADEIAQKPRAARLALLETYTVGPAALAKAMRADSLFEAMLAESFSRAPDQLEVPPLLLKGIVTGIAAVTRARLLSGREREMLELADELLDWSLSYRDAATSELARLHQRPSRGASAFQPATTRQATGHTVAREDDRSLILTAVAKLNAAEGYRYLTVPRIRAAAGVSRRNFDAHFEGVNDCFLAALEMSVEEAFESAATQTTGNDWTADVHRTIAALCTRIARDSRLAKLAFLDVAETGLGGIYRREAIVRAAVEFFVASAPHPQRPDELTAEASIGAVWGVLQHYVTSGRALEIPRIAATLSFLILAPTVGAQAATEAIRREQERY